MKFFVFAAIFAAASALPIASVVNTGSSAVSRSDDGCGNYEFGYNEDHATGGTFRKEQGGPGYQSGSYGLRDADGRYRTVNYVADALGYRASVSTNEPGVDVKQDPAAVDLNLGGYGAGIAAPVLAAPVAADLSLGGYGAGLGGYGAGLAAPIAAPVAADLSLGGYGAGLAAPIAAPVLSAGLVSKSYDAPVYNDAYTTPVAFPSSYSVATEHTSYAPAIESVVAGHDPAYNTYGKLY